jgi:tetratricopeptide (TPR) repeat protein
MSLLLDALKRAEQAKQAKGGEPEAAPQPATAEAHTAATSSTSSGLSLQLEDIKSSPQPQVAPTSTQALLGDPQRESAKNVFAAKQRRSPESRSWLLPLLGSAVLVIGAGGWYVWTQVNKVSSPSAARAQAQVTQAPAPITQAPRELPAAKPDTGQVGQSAPPPVALSSAASAVPLPTYVESAKQPASAKEKARESLIKSMKEATAAKDTPVVLRMTTGIEPPRVSAELASAYTALRAGNYAEARRLYAAVIAGDGMNLDARLGLATALARSGDNAGAAREYRRALEIDPRNSTALASLLVLSDQNNLPALEVELKTLMAKSPDSAPLSFALGNLYAAQSRWTEAQQAYFDAFRFEPDNADYIYNLAVSLDQLKQSKLALDYYQRALTAAAKGGSQFDRAQASRRANELKSPS